MKYLFVTVTQKDGFQYPNPLKLSEVHLVNKILALPKTESIKIELMECDKAYYNQLFS